jgi:hypothetical protein
LFFSPSPKELPKTNGPGASFSGITAMVHFPWHFPHNSNMAMENTLFIGFVGDFPIEAPISSGFPIATFDDTGG